MRVPSGDWLKSGVAVLDHTWSPLVFAARQGIGVSDDVGSCRRGHVPCGCGNPQHWRLPHRTAAEIVTGAVPAHIKLEELMIASEGYKYR